MSESGVTVDLVSLVEEHYRAGDVEAGKKMVSGENTFISAFRQTIVQWLCLSGPDEPRFLHYLLDCGVSHDFEQNLNRH